MGRPVVHFEIGCRDKERSSAFYRDAFGWDVDAGPLGLISTGSEGGIPGHITALGHEPHNYTNVYVEVERLEDAIARVVELGGRAVVPPVALPTGRFAWIADIEGTIVGLIEAAAA